MKHNSLLNLNQKSHSSVDAIRTSSKGIYVKAYQFFNDLIWYVVEIDLLGITNVSLVATKKCVE